MFKWLTKLRTIWENTFTKSGVTEEMVYQVVPTTWIRKKDIKERLTTTFEGLKKTSITDSEIYSFVAILEVKGLIECSVKRPPKFHYDVGICRRKGPSRPSVFNEHDPVLAKV